MSTICPYPGLRPFNEEESIFFKGRELQVEQLVKKLEEKKFLMVNGASGDGKSSLIFAGVIPYAKAGFFKAKYNNWLVADFRPERSPLHNLTRSLSTQLKLSDIQKTEKELGYGFSALCDLYKASEFYIDELNPGWINADESQKKLIKRKAANLLILVDQFEEFFTNPENYQNGIPSLESQKTVNLLLETYKLAAAQDLPIYVVCTMRSDYIGQCAAFRGLPEAIGYSQFFVPRLKRQEIEQVIKGPAILAGGSVSKRLTQTLINNLVEGFDQLPILQHALNHVWKTANNGSEQLDLIHLAKVGGLSPKALAIDERKQFETWFETLPSYKKELLQKPSLSNVLNAHVNELLYQNNETILSLNELEETKNVKVIKRIFQSLTAYDNGRVVRRRASVGEVIDLINDPLLSLADFNKLLLQFRNEGNSFIKPYLSESSEILSKEIILDITHESLIRNWQLLQKWVEEEEENVQTWREIEKPLNVWKKNVSFRHKFIFLPWRVSKIQKYVLSSGLYALYHDWNKKFPIYLAWLQRISKDYKQEDIDEFNTFLKKSKRAIIRRRLLPLYIFLFVMFYNVRYNSLKNEEADLATKNQKIQKELVIKAEHNARVATLAKQEADSLKAIAQLKEKKAVFDLDSTLRNAEMVVGATKMNVLFIGVRNPIDIAVSGVSNDNLVVYSTDGCKITRDKDKGKKYIAVCDAGTKQVQISCAVKNGKKLIPINGKYNFRVKPLPDPVAYIDGFFRQIRFRSEELKGFNKLSASVLNFDFSVDIKLLSFTVTGIFQNVFNSESVKGSEFSDAQKKLFNANELNVVDTAFVEDPVTGVVKMQVTASKRLIIEDIKVAMPDGTTRILPPLTILIGND